MNLKSLSDVELESRLKELVREERRITLEVLHHMLEFERRRLYAGAGKESLFEYCVTVLGYAGGCAQRRIDSMRLLREVPEIEEMILEGTVHMTNLSQVSTFCRREDIESVDRKREIVESIENLSVKQAERALVSQAAEPEKHIPERTRAISEDLTEVKFVADTEMMEELKELRQLLSHKFPGMSLKDAIRYGLVTALEKHRPKAPKNKLPPAEVAPTDRPTAEQKRYVRHRAKHQCEYPGCTSRHRLEIDHVQPYGMGGLTHVDNLRLLCRNHNQWAAIQAYGRDEMARYQRR